MINAVGFIAKTLFAVVYGFWLAAFILAYVSMLLVKEFIMELGRRK